MKPPAGFGPCFHKASHLGYLFILPQPGDQKVFLESSSSSLALKSLVRPELRVQGLSPVEDFKACKNAVEIQGLRRACKRDSVALCELLATLRRKLCDAKPGEQPVNEVGGL